MPVLRWEEPSRTSSTRAHKVPPTPLEIQDAFMVYESSHVELNANPGRWAVLVDDREPGFCQRLASAFRHRAYWPDDGYQVVGIDVEGRSRLYARRRG